ncbi:MAG TPA: tetratricopeptide repeat protein [Ignavibacteriaceae bacterium]|nr:tetratricopeptide repeat protein [Ignavibacteriaceae bacterium]
MKTTFKFLILSFLIAPVFINAQEVDIIPYLKQIEQGKAGEVKTKLSELKQDYPNSSNVLFLEGVLTENAQDAVVIYQKIVDKYPKSAYADAALYRIYSYYFALGLYNTADKNFEKLKKDYPESPYIKMASMNVTTEENTTPPVKTVDQKDETVYKYTVQAGAFTNKDNAVTLQKEFVNAGLKSFIKEKNVGGTIFNVVYVGQFVGKNEAEDFKAIANSQFNISGRVVEIEK